MMLAASLGSWAQPAPPGGSTTLPTVTVTGTIETPPEKDDLRVRSTTIGKGTQELRDIPQTVTVQTERLIDDRNLDDLREVLRTTSGVTFQAGETGEEDVRMRGFSLQQAGDIHSDGLRDAPLYERDTFNNDRVEVLKGSASMLFGKGSTGGIVNQVSKQPFLMTQHEVDYTFGSGKLHRLAGDFNFHTGQDAAFRFNAIVHDADHSGARQRKAGIAPTFRWGIGTRDEFSVGLYHLQIEGRPLYNHPWYLDNGRLRALLPARNYYGLASDHLDTQATHATVSHVHRFDHDGELKTTVRHGRYERDLLASVVRFDVPGFTPDLLNGSTPLSRSPKGRIGQSDLMQLTSDYSARFDWGGMRHELLAGIDIYREDARRNSNFTGPLGGAPLVFPPTTVGTPNDGASVPDTRGAPQFDTFKASNVGLYAQDVVAITPTLKLVGGVRFDRFRASYRTFARPPTPFTPAGTPAFSDSIGEGLWSPRIGALYQPDDASSYYLSFGTSYNTSGDTYGYAVSPANTSRLANTPPEKSRNFEVGGKWELFGKRALLGVAAFYSEKYNERNTDPDIAAAQELLSGKRHAAGLEFNLAGRLAAQWDLFFNHTWIPAARIDSSNVQPPLPPGDPSAGAQRQGDRPALTPRHSGSLWTTYRVLPQLRVGAGLNWRSEQNPEGARHVHAPGFATVDAMAEYTFNESWSAKLNVSNLGDKLYADSLYRGFYAPGAPRRVELTLKTVF
jgi:catecholate siderophore receptor